MLIVFLIFSFNNYTTNKYLVLIFGFLLAFLFDFIEFDYLGKTSFLITVGLYLFFLYEKKFKKESQVFQVLAFVVFGLFFQFYINKINLFQVAWFTLLFYLTIKARDL